MWDLSDRGGRQGTGGKAGWKDISIGVVMVHGSSSPLKRSRWRNEILQFRGLVAKIGNKCQG